MPLTSITAWELLFDSLNVKEGAGNGKTLLIIGAGGGVGSILVQLARKLTGLTVIGNASRTETREWVSELGTHHVIDHCQPLQPQMSDLGHKEVDHVTNLTHTDTYYEQIVALLKPERNFALIDDPSALDAMPLKRKSISLQWEFMFTRSMYRTKSIFKQHELLNRVAELIDSKVLNTTNVHFTYVATLKLNLATGIQRREHIKKPSPMKRGESNKPSLAHVPEINVRHACQP